MRRALALSAFLLSAAACAANAKEILVNGGTGQELNAAAKTAFDGDALVLTQNVAVGTLESVKLYGVKNLTIDGKGFSISGADAQRSGTLINGENENLTLKDLTIKNSNGMNYTLLLTNVQKLNLSSVAFLNNSLGGAINSRGSLDVTISESALFSGNVAQNSNYVSGLGGAIENHGALTIRTTGSADVAFINNRANYNGGAIVAGGETSLDIGGTLIFRGNKTTNQDGGAVYSSKGLTVKTGGEALFSGNSAGSYGNGGALYVESGDLRMELGGASEFSNNSAVLNGGAIYVRKGSVGISADDSLTFSGNSSQGDGGAIFSTGSVDVNAEGQVLFADNKSLGNGADGGAISSTGGGVSLNTKGPALFSGNSATEWGGALYVSPGTINLRSDAELVFVGNSAGLGGGAITVLADSGVGLTISGKSIVFGDNKAQNRGGAIFSNSSISFITSDDMEFLDNKAHEGGVIYNSSGDVSMDAGKSLTFSDNSVHAIVAQNGDINLTAGENMIFATSTDTLYATGAGNITLKAQQLHTAAGLTFTAANTTIKSGATFFPSVTLTDGGLNIAGNAVLENGLKLVVTGFTEESADMSGYYTVRSADFLTVSSGNSLAASNDFSFTNISTDYRDGDIVSSDKNGATVLTLSRTNKTLTYFGKDYQRNPGYWTTGTTGGTAPQCWFETNSSGEFGDRDYFYTGDDVNFIDSVPDDPEGINRNVIVSGPVYPRYMNVKYGASGDHYTFTGDSADDVIDAKRITISENVLTAFSSLSVTAQEEFTALKGASVSADGDGDGKTTFKARRRTIKEDASIIGDLWSVENAELDSGSAIGDQSGKKRTLITARDLTTSGSSFYSTTLKAGKIDITGPTSFSGSSDVTAVDVSSDIDKALMQINKSTFRAQGMRAKVGMDNGSLVILGSFLGEVSGSGNMNVQSGASAAFSSSSSVGGYIAERNSTTILLNKDVSLTGQSFTFGALSTLALHGPWFIDAPALKAVPQGASLKVAGGALLSITNGEIDIPYMVAGDGFSDYSDADNWSISTDVYYDYDEWNDGAVTLKLNDGGGGALFLDRVSTALRVADGFGELMGDRSRFMLNGRQTSAALARHFVPQDDGKKRDLVWASVNYHRNRVDGLELADRKQDMDTRYYGVTIGVDRICDGGSVLGAGLDVGTYDSDGKGDWSSSKADGKFIGLGLYGAREYGAWTLSGQLSNHWFKSDMETVSGRNSYNADDVRGRVFSAALRADYGGLKLPWNVKVIPFFGAEFTYYGDERFMAKKNGVDAFRSENGSVNQWTFPLGARFDWGYRELKNGWRTRKGLELAYVLAAGDMDYGVKLTTATAGKELRSYRTAAADKNSFRAAASFEGKKGDFTLGLSLRGQFSSNQRDLGVSLKGMWEF